MREIGIVRAPASRFVLGVCCFLGLAQAAGSHAFVTGRDLPQAIVAYGFLRWDYLDLDKLFTSGADLAIVQNLKALDVALKSLDCDVPTRLAFPHKPLILPPSATAGWVGFSRSDGRNSPDSGWLFVTQPVATTPQRVLVVFSTVSPGRTTIFWLEEAKSGYVARLVYDSFKKAQITNQVTVIGAVTEVRIEKNSGILLRDRGEPGLGPREFLRTGRVFRLDLLRNTVALVTTGTPPPH